MYKAVICGLALVFSSSVFAVILDFDDLEYGTITFALDYKGFYLDEAYVPDWQDGSPFLHTRITKPDVVFPTKHLSGDGFEIRNRNGAFNVLSADLWFFQHGGAFTIKAYRGRDIVYSDVITGFTENSPPKNLNLDIENINLLRVYGVEGNPFHIDNISVSAYVSEPASIALLSLALLGWARIRARN